MVSTSVHIVHRSCWFSCSCLVILFLFPFVSSPNIHPSSSSFSSHRLSHRENPRLRVRCGQTSDIQESRVEVVFAISSDWRGAAERWRAGYFEWCFGVEYEGSGEDYDTSEGTFFFSFVSLWFSLSFQLFLFRLGLKCFYWLIFLCIGCCGFECGWYTWWDCCCFHVSTSLCFYHLRKSRFLIYLFPLFPLVSKVVIRDSQSTNLENQHPSLACFSSKR